MKHGTPDQVVRYAADAWSVYPASDFNNWFIREQQKAGLWVTVDQVIVSLNMMDRIVRTFDSITLLKDDHPRGAVASLYGLSMFLSDELPLWGMLFVPSTVIVDVYYEKEHEASNKTAGQSR